MTIKTKTEILDILNMPDADFASDVASVAALQWRETHGTLTVTAMLGYSNICRNQCLYCGMCAGNSAVPRYRMTADEMEGAIRAAQTLGLRRLFLVSGEDPKFPMEDLLGAIRTAKSAGFFISLAAGELTDDQFDALRDAGVDEYVIKFEMADPTVFNRLNPSTSTERRMAAIRRVRERGFRLASGNIIDYPGQTMEQLADEIVLMRDLGISWAPVIPFMPAQGTPLAAEKPGRLSLLYREIAVLRLMLPDLHITAQQPGPDPAQGLAGRDGNLAALKAGADMLFVDLLPDARTHAFHVVDNRSLQGLSHIRQMADACGLTLSFQ